MTEKTGNLGKMRFWRSCVTMRKISVLRGFSCVGVLALVYCLGVALPQVFAFEAIGGGNAAVLASSMTMPTSYSPHEEDHLLNFRKGSYVFDMGVLMRGYYLNDQRLQWTGYEATMGAEGILTPSVVIKQPNGGAWSFNGEFFVQDPWSDNMLVWHDDALDASVERQSYLGNVKQKAFELSQLNIRYRDSLFEFKAGKFESPFGNYHAPLMSNSRWDAPFIRTESILWRDAGFLFRMTPSVFDVGLAITNGCEGGDTNSMKAVIGRVGLNFPQAMMGISGLYQDGEGSEDQKQYRRHAGMDAMVRFGNWTLSSEVIYDEYGMRHEIDPNQIFWKRSIYYRQINKRDSVPITGWGGYIDLSYNGHPWLFSINYGEYHPEQLRNPVYPQHDIINRRLILKLGWNITKNIQWYSAFLLETEGFLAQVGRPREGKVLLSGVKMEF